MHAVGARAKKLLATKLWLVNFVLAMYHDTGHKSCFKITKDLKEDKIYVKLSCINRNAGIAINVLEKGQSQTPNQNNIHRLSFVMAATTNDTTLTVIT